MQCWVAFQDIIAAIEYDFLYIQKIVSIRRKLVIAEIEPNNHSAIRRINRHFIRSILNELPLTVLFNVMSIEISPSNLDIEPKSVTD